MITRKQMYLLYTYIIFLYFSHTLMALFPSGKYFIMYFGIFLGPFILKPFHACMEKESYIESKIIHKIKNIMDSNYFFIYIGCFILCAIAIVFCVDTFVLAIVCGIAFLLALVYARDSMR